MKLILSIVMLLTVAFGLNSEVKAGTNDFDPGTSKIKERRTCDWNYKDLVKVAKKNNFTVTSTRGGRHNRGSAHYRGLAIDVRTRDKTNLEVEYFIAHSTNKGIIVLDERTRPKRQRVWGGPHLHLQVPRCDQVIKPEGLEIPKQLFEYFKHGTIPGSEGGMG